MPIFSNFKESSIIEVPRCQKCPQNDAHLASMLWHREPG